MSSCRLISIMLLFALVQIVTAATTCQTYFDYCYTNNNVVHDTFYKFADVTFGSGDCSGGYALGTYATNYGSGLESFNIEGRCYLPVAAPYQYVNVSLVQYGSGSYSSCDYNTTNYGGIGTYITCTPAVGSGYSYQLVVCFNGDYSGFKAYSGNGAPSGSTTIEDVSNGIYPYYRRNWTFRWEENSSLVGFYGQAATLNVYCTNHQSFSYNLSANPNNGSLTIYTKEQPKYVLTYGGIGIERTREDVENFLNDNYYITAQSATKYTFALADYTAGTWKRSTLYIQKSINDEWDNVEVQKFSNDNLLYVWLVNNTQYKLVAKTSTKSEDIDLFRPNGIDTTKTITLNTPVLSEIVASYSDLRVAWTQDYATSQVGATLYTTDSNLVSSFYVFNASTNAYVITYGSSATGSSIYSYTLPDKNMPVFVDLWANSTKYGLMHWSKLIVLYNQSAPMNGSAFSASLPSTIMQTSTTTWKKLMALMLTWLVLFVTCKASDYGTGAGLGVVTYSFMWYVNWIPQAEVPFWFIALMGLTAAGLKFNERRYV